MEVTMLKPESPTSESKQGADTAPKLAVVHVPSEAAASTNAAAVSLRLVNQSSGSGPQVVIVQSNQGSADSPVIAWRVIENLSPGWSHPFVYPSQTQLSVTDPWGNVSPALSIEQGQQAEVVMGPNGTELRLSSEHPENPAQFQVFNNLSQGAVAVNVLKDGLTLARTPNLGPGWRVAYQFQPSLFIGVASHVTQGEAVDSAVASALNTELSLKGIRSADIVMTGGGEGSPPPPFQFRLENVVTV